MKKIISINPANNAVLGEVVATTQAEIHKLVEKAHQAKQHWKSLGVERRIDMLKPLLQAFNARKTEIAQLITQEMGKPITESVGGLQWDLGYLEDFFRHAPKYLEDEMTYHKGNTQHKIVYEPRGVVGAIVPWNYPSSNFTFAVIPNLIAGNTVVFKHSEECILTGKLFADIMHEAHLPEGVFSAIYGDQEEGEMLANANLDMIWFIGSSQAGKKLYEIAGKKFIKSILEMGGSNPALVFEDVKIETVIPRLMEGRFSNCGQRCDAIKRVIVHRSIFDIVVDQLVEAVQKMKIGDPSDPQTQIGPLAAMRQLKLLEAQVEDAVKEGARIETGGKRCEGYTGAYYTPTVITDVKPHMRVWKEEVFGPVLIVVPFDTDDEAIELANDTVYGLGASVFCSDLLKAQRIARQIDAGSININEGDRWMSCNPFGGFKQSGMGCEHGRQGFQELCHLKVIAEGGLS